jgi:post-segregation antitoxin (ccd killing protein)
MEGETVKKFLLKVIVDGDAQIVNLVRVADEKTSTITLATKDEVEGAEAGQWKIKNQKALSDRGAIHQLLKHYSSTKNSCFVTCVNSALCS